MKTVDPDRRVNYSSLEADEVIADLHSHPMGLTHAESTRRLGGHGPNALPYTAMRVTLLPLVRQPLAWLVGLLLVGSAVSLAADSPNTAVTFLVLAIINAGLTLWQAWQAKPYLDDLQQLIPLRAKVIRNGSTEEIDARALALGDIVTLHSGDVVPADLRLIKEDDFRTNEQLLLGSDNFVRKFVSAISGEVAIAERHNLVYAGTTVATGSAQGVVIATGLHTELGRLTSLIEAGRDRRERTTSDQRDISRTAVLAARLTTALAAILMVLALIAGLQPEVVAALLSAVIAAAIPSGVLIAMALLDIRARQRINQTGISLPNLLAAQTLGDTDILLFDQSVATKAEPHITDLLIGRDIYSVHGGSFAPQGQIKNSNHTSLTPPELAKLSLFFTAGALTADVKVCQPDAQHRNWYAIGDQVDGAVVALARKAGLNTESLLATYGIVQTFQYNASRGLLASVRRQGDDLVVFVKGTPAAVTDKCKKLWDHGHIRNFTARDHEHYANYAAAETSRGRQTIALAYRILPKNTNLQTLTLQSACQDVTFLGIISSEHTLYDEVPHTVASLHHAHIAVSVLSRDAPAIATAVAHKAHIASTSAAITSGSLRQLADADVLQSLLTGSVFTSLTPEDVLRLTEVAETAGHHVTVVGNSHSDQPAHARATVGLHLARNNFHSLYAAIERSRTAVANAKNILRSAVANAFSGLGVVGLSTVALVLYHVPPAITALQLVALAAISQVLPIVALAWDRAPASTMHGQPAHQQTNHFSAFWLRETVLFGLFGSFIAYGDFWLFFVRHGLDPQYIDSLNPLVTQATSLAFVSLAACAGLNVLFIRAASHKHIFTRQLWHNRLLLAAFAASFGTILLLIYTPPFQQFFGFIGLDVIDWLMVLVASASYCALRWLQRHTRLHSHYEVLQLYKKI